MRDKQSLSLATLLIAAVLIGLFFLSATVILAQPPLSRPCSPIVTDPDRMIWDAPGINPGDEMYADVAYNSQDNEYLVIFEWEDAGGGSGRDIASIVVDASGQSALSPNGVATTDAYTDTHPTVAYNPTDNTYLAVWERVAATGDSYIQGAILHSNGALSSTFTIANWTGDQRYPDVAYSAACNCYLVVWEDYYTHWANRPDIYGAVVSASGAILDYESVTGLNAAWEQTRPAVTTNASTGRWMVTWQDSRPCGTTSDDIYGQQMQFAGSILSPWGDQLHIGALVGWGSTPDVAWGQVGSGDGEFLVVWPENNTMYAQRIRADSVLVGGVITVSDYASGKYAPAVTFDSSDGAWWVVWADNRDYG
ncbi:MAG: hypothetical protein H5T62_10210 [Anaerolineae bacterium]|nr:hypothetical protein [Anaerolineae bacterium]